MYDSIAIKIFITAPFAFMFTYINANFKVAHRLAVLLSSKVLSFLLIQFMVWTTAYIIIKVFNITINSDLPITIITGCAIGLSYQAPN